MYRLRISLILAVLASVIGTGWIADKLFNPWVDNEMEPVQHLQARGHMLHALLEKNLLSVTALKNFERGNLDLPGPVHSKPYGLTMDNGPGIESVQLVAVDALPLPESLQDQLLAGEELILESDDSLHWYRYVELTGDVLSVSRSALPADGHTMRLLFTLLFYVCVACLILAWVYPLILQLRRLGVAAESLGKGDLTRRIVTREGSRLHDLELQFNRMAQRLQLLVEDNKLLCSAVSHDLRTPLSRLRFGIDALHEKLNSQQEWGESERHDAGRYLDRIGDDLMLMESLVSALLEFARLDQSLHTIPLVPMGLADIVREEALVQPSCTVEIRVIISADSDRILGEERYARMLLRNLVENALRFAESLVVIRLFEYAGELVLSVEDNGMGFEAGSQQQLLKPFERGRKPHTDIDGDAGISAGKGYGLGLAIVERLSQWFDARLTLDSSDELGGARVVVRFKPHQS